MSTGTGALPQMIPKKNVETPTPELTRGRLRGVADTARRIDTSLRSVAGSTIGARSTADERKKEEGWERAGSL